MPLTIMAEEPVDKDPDKAGFQYEHDPMDYPLASRLKITVLTLRVFGGYFFLSARTIPRLTAETTRLRILTQRLTVSMISTSFIYHT